MASLIDSDWRVKYKHLFRERKPSKIACTLRDEITVMLENFNHTVKNRFYAESRVLIPATDSSMPREGIIIEHTGKDFDEDFSYCLERITELANKLEHRTTLYEYSFKKEFCNKKQWVDYENRKVAYNLAL